MTNADRALAVRLCRYVAANPEKVPSGNYQEAAIQLGARVRRLRGKPGTVSADYTGEDNEAAEIAAEAWCAVDPEPLGIESPDDPRRDAAAADLLEQGWNP